MCHLLFYGGGSGEASGVRSQRAEPGKRSGAESTAGSMAEAEDAAAAEEAEGGAAVVGGKKKKTRRAKQPGQNARKTMAGREAVADATVTMEAAAGEHGA